MHQGQATTQTGASGGLLRCGVQGDQSPDNQPLKSRLAPLLLAANAPPISTMPHQRAYQAREEELEGLENPNASSHYGQELYRHREVEHARTRLQQRHEQGPYAIPRPIGAHHESTSAYKAPRSRGHYSLERAGAAAGFYAAGHVNHYFGREHPQPASMAAQEPANYAGRGQQQPQGAYSSQLAPPWQVASASNTTPGADSRQSNHSSQAYQELATGHVYGRPGIQDRYYDRPGQADSDAISDQGSHSSLVRLDVVARVPGDATPGQRTPSRSPHSFGGDEYDPYGDYSTHRLPNLGMVDPNEIDDDGDDGINYGRRGPSTSVLSLGGSSRNGGEGANVASGATAGTIMGSLTGRNSNGDGGHYAPVNSASTAYSGAGANGSALKSGTSAAGGEKSQRKSSSGARWRKFRLLILLVIGLLVVVGAAVGVTVGIESRVKSEKSASSTSSSSSNTAGDLDINSPEIQSLMNNANLHKVFPGINYTPVNTQYPDCLTNPPSQNNITKDMAVLSQLTNTIRLYGTDCKQTEMVLHALVHLKLDSTVKVWLGVWQDGNETTNARQLAQTWDILDKYGAKPFKGLIVANEVLFRKQMSTSQLGNLLDEVRTNLTSKGMSLPVATSDLGDNWTADLAQASDLILANIHVSFLGHLSPWHFRASSHRTWATCSRVARHGARKRDLL